MKKTMMAVAALSALSLSPAFGAGGKPATPDDIEPAAAEAPKEAPKKKPKKLPEYQRWDEAAAAAEAYSLPIVVLVDVNGDKAGRKYKAAFFGNKDVMKELSQYALFYHFTYPAVKKVAKRGAKPVDKNAPPEPDVNAVKESERVALTKLTAIMNPQKTWGAPTTAPLPMLAVADHTCKLYGQPVIAEDDISVTRIVDELRTMFGNAKASFEVGKKTQKLIDNEAKEQAKREKRERR